MTRIRPFQALTLAFCARSIGAVALAHAQQPEVRFGGAYAGLDVRRQQLVDNWVARFGKVTGKPIEPGPFYDDELTVSTKTTFDAVTHALMTTKLTDRTGASLGDALALIDQVDSLRGEDAGRRLRAALEAVGKAIGDSRSLGTLLTGVEPILPGIRVMNHSSARVFTLTSIPNTLADGSECAARARRRRNRSLAARVWGGFGMNVRFKTRGGEAGVLRVLWRRENANWRITSYDVEQP